eukprot:1273987-Amorphochlora_amoeboformis.AAC.2
MRRGIPNLFKSGTAHIRGKEEAVHRNIDACKDLASITRTSLGPNGAPKSVFESGGFWIIRGAHNRTN